MPRAPGRPFNLRRPWRNALKAPGARWPIIECARAAGGPLYRWRVLAHLRSAHFNKRLAGASFAQ